MQKRTRRTGGAVDGARVCEYAAPRRTQDSEICTLRCPVGVLDIF